MPDFISFPSQRLFYFLVIVVFYVSLTLSSTASILLASPSPSLDMNLLSIYEKPENAALLHSRYYVEGVLFGAGVSPEIPMPDAWLTWTIKHHGQMQDKQQADEITDALFAYFKFCLAMMTNNEVTMPNYAIFEENAEYSHQIDTQSPLSQWLSGLLTAHANTEKVWQNAWTIMQNKSPATAPDLAKNLKHSLGMFSTFADMPLAIEQAHKRGQEDFESKLPSIAKALPNALKTYVEVSGELAAYLPNQFETFVQKKH
jgi:uncharacterized protein